MFAYCNNNPASYEDSSGYSRFPCAVTIAEALGGGFGYPLTSDIADTPAEQVYGVINGQENLPYANDRIGLGSYGKSGCAFIAVYNAMQLIGKPQSLHSVTSEVFLYHGTVCFGAGGVGPWSIKSYFMAHGVETEGSFSAAELTQDISEGDVIVFTVWNDKTITGGWHAMTALYTNGRYLVFNQYNDSTTYVPFSSLEDVYSRGVWIYGIRIR